jgi:hypothetical protein
MSKKALAAQQRETTLRAVIQELFTLIDKDQDITGILLPVGRTHFYVRLFIVTRDNPFSDYLPGQLKEISQQVGVLLNCERSMLGTYGGAVALKRDDYNGSAEAAFCALLDWLEPQVWGQPTNGRGELVERTPLKGNLI